MVVLSGKSQEAVVIRGGYDFEQVFQVMVLEVYGGCVKQSFETDGNSSRE